MGKAYANRKKAEERNENDFYINSARKIPPFRVAIWIAEIILAIITINYYNKVKITKN